jgi:hypothetical protein
MLHFLKGNLLASTTHDVNFRYDLVERNRLYGISNLLIPTNDVLNAFILLHL